MLSLAMALAAAPALAQDNTSSGGTSGGAASDDELPEDSVKSERDAVKSGKAEAKDEAPQGKEKIPFIKTIQRKNFMKIGRYEIGVDVGSVSNDPFLNRWIIGAVADYHFTELFALELQLGYAPNFDDPSQDCDPDWKELSCQLLEKNSVSPDISRLTTHASAALAYSPIYGKAAVGRSIIAFDIFGAFGLGVVNTTDDLVALQEDGPEAQATQEQWHPTTMISGGARVAFTDSVAARLEVKSMTYIETVKSTTLEMKNNLIIQGGVSFFFPGMK